MEKVKYLLNTDVICCQTIVFDSYTYDLSYDITINGIYSLARASPLVIEALLLTDRSYSAKFYKKNTFSEKVKYLLNTVVICCQTIVFDSSTHDLSNNITIIGIYSLARASPLVIEALLLTDRSYSA